jgi:hypothetical protein
MVELSAGPSVIPHEQVAAELLRKWSLPRTDLDQFANHLVAAGSSG